MNKAMPKILTGWQWCPKCQHELTAVQEDPHENPHLHCESCNFRHYANPFPTVNCLVLNDKKNVLLVKRKFEPKAGTWCMPGGFIDIGEHPLEAAKRELQEEAGIDAENWKLTDALPDWYNRAIGASTVNLCYESTVVLGQTPTPGSDAEEARWFDKDEVLSLLAFDNQIAMYQNWLKEN